MRTVDGRLRASGLKATATRRAVFLALEEYPHSGVGAVLTRVRDSLPEASAQAVYGVLLAFTDAGLVRRIEPEGHPPTIRAEGRRQPPPRRLSTLRSRRRRRVRRR